jgi:predicted secreted Zn-dependent protease
MQYPAALLRAADRVDASLYSWTDAKGIQHFSNDPPTNRSAEFRTTDEYIPNEKEHDTKEIESPDLPRDSGGRQKAMAISKRTGSGPNININFKYYDFVSVNINDIIGVMWKKSPIKHHGTSYCASTDPHIKYYFYTAEEDGNWYIDRVHTTVDVTFTMPRWADYQKASWDQQQKWDKFYASLMEHENGHKDIAIEAAKEIENKLLNSYSPSEKILRKVANSMAWMIIKKSWVLQKQYDENTKHGVKTGAVLR